jgi:molybdopterin-synthase adenylyltransferase
MRMGLKPCAWNRQGDALFVVCDPSRQIELADPGGAVEMLLNALAEKPRTRSELRQSLAETGVEVTPEELAEAVTALDRLRLLADPDAAPLMPAELNERFFSNLAFFELFASLGTSKYELQRRLNRAHVLHLGTGGLGSNVLQSMAGLGVGRLTLLDDDVVESRNFVRQWLYRRRDIGRPKVHRAAQWVREFDDALDVTAVHRRIDGPEDVRPLLDGVDLVVSGVDQPNDIDTWVNEACVGAGVPWVRGGMIGSELVYFSVDPGRSPCWACRVKELGAPSPTDAALRMRRTNRGIGPAAALVGSLVALEALRYLTRFEPPYAAGTSVYVTVPGGAQQRREAWAQDEDCEQCALARRSPRAGASRGGAETSGIRAETSGVKERKT